MASKTIINWQAKEYIERKKTGGWYVGLAVVTAALVGLSIWLQYYSFLAVIVAAVIALIVYITRAPRTLTYSLTEDGISEGNNLHPFDKFKSFGIFNEDNHYSIILIPKARFGTRMTVYFPEAEGEQIVDFFGERLPMEEVKLDFLDKLVRWLKI
jgi:hypothetical protein